MNIRIHMCKYWHYGFVGLCFVVLLIGVPLGFWIYDRDHETLGSVTIIVSIIASVLCAIIGCLEL